MAETLKAISSWQKDILKARTLQGLGISLNKILFDGRPSYFFLEIKFSGVLPWLGPRSLLLKNQKTSPKIWGDQHFDSFRRKSKDRKWIETSLKLPSWDPGVLFLSWTDPEEEFEAESKLELLAPTLSLVLPNLALGEAQLPFRSRSKDFFQALLANSTDFIVFMEGAQAKFVSSNVQSLLGYTQYELISLINDGMAVVHPDDLPLLAEKIKEEQGAKMAHGKHQYRLRKKNGEYVWYEWMVRRFFDDEGNFTHSILNCRNVSSQIESENEVINQKNLLNEILDLIPVDVFLKDKKGKYLFVNKSTCKSLRVSREDLIGKTDREIFPRAIADTFIKGDKKVREGEEFDNVEETTHFGGVEKIYLSKKSIVNLGEGANEVLMGTSIDVTDRVISERTARETSDLINNIAQLLSESLFVFDLDQFSYVYSNFRLFKKLGYSSQDFGKDLIGQKMDDGFLSSLFMEGEYERYLNELEEIRKGEKDLYESEYLLKDRNGEDFFILSRKLPFKRNEKGKVTQFVGLTIDITEQKRREKELVQARKDVEEALKVKEEFLSVMSHEIRTPLNAIVGLSNLLKESPTAGHLPERMKALKFSADKLLLLVNDILDFSKVQSGKLSVKPAPFNIKDLVEDVYQTFFLSAMDKGLDFKLKIDCEKDCQLIGDEGRISQVLFNLLSNAIKFTDQGEVSLSVKGREEKGDMKVQIQVQDSGIGMDPNNLEKIFDPFFQLDQKVNRSFGGTGLGLTISKKIAEEHGGKLLVESKPMVGSKFTLLLSLEIQKRKKTSEKQTKPVKIDSRKKCPKVLYIEDVETNRELMSGFSNAWNFDLELAESGKEGLEKIASIKFDMILLDIQMPGMDGFAVLEELKLLKKNTPIYAITADTSEKTQKALMKMGTKGVIPKPFDPEDLKAIIFGIEVPKKELKQRKEDTFNEFRSVFSSEKKAYKDFLNSLKKEIKRERSELKKPDIKVFKSSVHKLKGSMGNSAGKKLAKKFGLVKELSGSKIPKDLQEDILNSLGDYLMELEVEINQV